MANALDEMSDVTLKEGHDVNVIAKKIPVTVGTGSKVFEVALWVCGLIPGLIFMYMKVKAKNYFQQLEQKIQHNASQIDNYLEQRVVVLQNAAQLVNKAITLDKETFTDIAKLRAGSAEQDEARNEIQSQLDVASKKFNMVFENYPELQAHNEIMDAMKQNMYLQREITASREFYNDSINTWNRDIFVWPTKQIVAAKEGYTTRIPFIASEEIKEKARGTFFN